jgi:hypothetical protein
MSDDLQNNKRLKSLKKPQSFRHLNGGKCEQILAKMPQKNIRKERELPLQFLYSQNDPQCNRGFSMRNYSKEAAWLESYDKYPVPVVELYQLNSRDFFSKPVFKIIS